MIAAEGDRRLILSHSGLRGRPGAGLDGEVVRGLLEGFLALLSERGLPHTLGLGRDARPSGERLAAEVIDEAIRRGADVVDFGVVSTPTAKLAARARGLGGAIIVTGSHLGPDWNGIKLVAAPDYWPLDVRRLPASSSPGGPAGALHRDETAGELHAAAVCEAMDQDAIRRAKLRVSLDGGCGQAAPLALERLGCILADGDADLGLLMDEDGDRLQLIDEHSNRLDPEATFPLVAISLGARRVVKGADTSRIAEEMAGDRNWSVRVTVPGELHLLEELAAWGADVAGEGNGGVVVPRVAQARDALAAAASVISLVATSGTTISRLAERLPRLSRRRASVPCDGPEVARKALEALAERFGTPLEDPQIGVMLERPGDDWALVRQSATEPVLRLTVESREEERADRIFEELRAALPADA